MTVAVWAVVVTYDRPALLRKCLAALQAQSTPPEGILVVDNASPADTPAMLAEHFRDVVVLRLPTNVGGAGGFRAGMERAFERGADWVWAMDDDALPTPEALARMRPHMTERFDTLVALASRLLDGTVDGATESVDDSLVELPKAMFVGFAIPALVPKRIGLPREDYFIYGDDSEYCLRLRRSGGAVYRVPDSVIVHVDWAASPQNVSIRLLGRRFVVYPRVPPWKAYYLARNRILTGRHHGMRYLAKGLVLSAGYLALSVVFAPLTVGSVASGLIDGLRGRSGKRAAP